MRQLLTRTNALSNKVGGNLTDQNNTATSLVFGTVRVAMCQLPPATISLTRTAGGTIGPIDESVYESAADTGSNFRISGCQHIYNIAASSLGIGTYRVDMRINRVVVGSGIFGLQ